MPALPKAVSGFFVVETPMRMTKLRRTTRGWIKPSQGAKYAGVSLKVFRRWLQHGLSPVSIEVGERKRKEGEIEKIHRQFVHYDDIDQFMEQHRVSDTSTTELAESLTEGL